MSGDVVVATESTNLGRPEGRWINPSLTKLRAADRHAEGGAALAPGRRPHGRGGAEDRRDRPCCPDGTGSLGGGGQGRGSALHRSGAADDPGRQAGGPGGALHCASRNDGGPIDESPSPSSSQARRASRPSPGAPQRWSTSTGSARPPARCPCVRWPTSQTRRPGLVKRLRAPPSRRDREVRNDDGALGDRRAV